MNGFQLTARRAAQALPLLLLVSVIGFTLLHLVPGGPLDVYLSSPNVRATDIARLREAYGLDRPLAVQYLAWLAAFVRGDWGYSFTDGRPVLTRLLERVPATLELMASALAIALVLSLVVSLWRARRPRGGAVVDAMATAGISLPVFWLGLVAQLLFAVALRWLPSSGRMTFDGAGLADRLRHLALPALVLATVHVAAWTRYLGASLDGVLRAPWMRAARSRGVREGTLLARHALRPALLPFVTVVLLDAALLVSGAVVTESVFAWPGLGGLFAEALARRDYALLMAFLMLTSTAIVTLNLVADVAYRWIDPRLRDA
ncbi:MAG: ABC transporter permease [Gemmatimonadetes bacterium]|nr:ABC transporter permease [Gemmatimonadota bacterium]